jgi:transposase-like protein
MDLQNPIFTDNDAAREALEAVRWPEGPFCPHCGTTGAMIAKVGGKRHRPGLFYCNGCKGQFTVTVGTVFERSKIPLSKWWMAVYLLSAGKKGTSSHQIHRTLKVSYKTAWFMTHRIREAMRNGALMPPMGTGGGAVEVDETFIGRVKGMPKRRGGYTHKQAVLSLIDRDTKQVRTFHIGDASASAIAPIVRENISREARMMTDEAAYYTVIGREVASHESVQHGKEEWARGDVHTNTLEGYFSVFKRGMKGVYQHCSEKHLHRYLAEFDFRYNNRVRLGVNDGARAVLAMKGIEGKRLTYRPTHSGEVIPFPGPEVR